MSAVTEAEFLADPRYSQFAGLSGVQLYLDDAEQDTPYSAWLSRQARGIKLLTAHRLTKVLASQNDNGASTGNLVGAVTSISASQESQSVSFGDASGSAKDGTEALESTIYGAEYLALRQRLIATGFRTGIRTWR